MEESKPSAVPHWLGAATAVVLGAIFVAAGMLKSWDPATFAIQIRSYQLLPAGMSPAMAILLPGWEVAAGVALWIPSWRRSGAMLSMGLLVLFLIAVSSALFRGLNIACGCFGVGEGTVSWTLLIFELFLLVLAFLSLKSRSGFSKTRRSPGPP